MNLNLLSYFLYLRDVSHKIAVSSDWTKCLKEKINKGNSSVYQLTMHEISDELTILSEKGKLYKLRKYLNSYSEKDAFLGLVSMCGKTQNSTLLGSIFNIPLIFEDNDDLIYQKPIFDVDNMVVNYQLLLSFFEFPGENLFYDFNKVIKEIKELVSEDGYINDFSLLNDIVSKKVLDFFTSNGISVPIDNKTLPDKIIAMKNSAFIDIDNVYLFAFDVPDEISTWKYLDSFCKELENSSSLDSELLNDMLIGREAPRNNFGFNKVILDLLPIQLSNTQKMSVENAFCEKVSYIQGPPGTGKSHTITAIALAALLQGKKTLIISQKDSALGVVKNKLDDFFTSFKDKDVLPYIYFDKKLKRKLKSDVERFIEKNKKIKDEEINTLKDTSLKLRDFIFQNLEKKQKIKNDVDYCYNQQFAFSESNKDYIEKFAKINRQINFENKFTLRGFSSSNQNFIALIKALENTFKNNGHLSKFQMFRLRQLNDNFNKKLDTNINFFVLLKDNILSEYLEKILDLGKDLYNLNKFQKDLVPKKKVDFLCSELNEIDKEIEKNLPNYFGSEVEKNIVSSFKELYKNQGKRAAFENFAKMLHFSKADVIIEKLRAIDYEDLLSVFPLWICEIRHIGEVLPNNKEMFDLIIIDEASQVNTAEIFPILYRGKNVCVVGDEKQLGLESVGLQFIISTKEEQQVWENYLGDFLIYDKARERDLIVTKSSFLNLITSNFSNRVFCKTMLDEHFRSMPQLASFTNNHFYDSNLKVMTETPEKALTHCFQAIKVDGKRVAKRNEKEVDVIMEIIDFLFNNINSTSLRKSEFSQDGSIGIVSLLREQVEYIKDVIYQSKWDIVEENDYFIINGKRVKCGTPEELQGDEFDCVIFSATVDENTRNSAHYTNARRLNVATSRARYFTYFIYSDVSRIEFFVRYLNHFGIKNNIVLHESDLIGWKYSEEDIASEFERYVAEFLKDIIFEKDPKNLKLFNQVPFAKKRLDFVIFNELNKKYVAIEVDGHFHFRNGNSRIYSDEHNERMELLTRAGWNILNTPYFCWYTGGKIDENHDDLKNEKQRLKEEILKSLYPEEFK